eukprot:snap_masked-scaffold_49-processed-gene-1.73-mRNA-1 protein AED:1.00 eAED:1.00 QI:0/-1/0/0/-1/1/1/0/68
MMETRLKSEMPGTRKLYDEVISKVPPADTEENILQRYYYVKNKSVKRKHKLSDEPTFGWFVFIDPDAY